jgi:uncharacterized protein YndB with AHSA1/START domain
MTQAAIDAYGVLTGPTTLKIERLLPGPIERVWDWITQSELRRRWLAAGEMALEEGGAVELVWHNDELTDPPGTRPEGMGAEHRMSGTILAVDPPRRLAYDWPGVGEVTMELTPQGSEVLLTLTHCRIPDPGTRLSVSAGWHSHLDLLVARLRGIKPAPHWDHFNALKAAYQARLPG